MLIVRFDSKNPSYPSEDMFAGGSCGVRGVGLSCPAHALRICSSSMAPATFSSAKKHKGKVATKQAVPKQPLTLPERLKRLFTSLCAQIDGGHFDNAIKTCEKSMFH